MDPTSKFMYALKFIIFVFSEGFLFLFRVQVHIVSGVSTVQPTKDQLKLEKALKMHKS